MISENLEECIKQHRFKEMFIDALGWDNFSSSHELEIHDQRIRLESVAEKRGLRVFTCKLHRTSLANRGLLRRIQRRVIRQHHEHIIVYYSDEPQKQVWQWAIHQIDGRKIRHREHPFLSYQPPRPLLERISNLRFTLNDEENATIVDALERTRRALDVIPEMDLFARYPNLSKYSDELAVAMRANEPGAFDRFCEFHQRLAKKASQMLVRWTGIEADDAEQVAMLGIIEAARRFDPTRGFQFSTYASFWIKQCCKHFALTNGYFIRFPPYVFWPSYKMEYSYQKLLASCGVSTNDEHLEDLLKLFGLSREHWQTFRATRDALRFSELERDEYHKIKSIPAADSPVLAHIIDEEMLQATLSEMMELDERECQIIGARYGLVHEEMTLQECGERLGITKERVRQIQTRGEDRLRTLLKLSYPGLFEYEDQAEIQKTKKNDS